MHQPEKSRDDRNPPPKLGANIRQQAFPSHSWKRVGEVEEGVSQFGMTLRDYFAAKVMHAYLNDIERAKELSIGSSFKSTADFIAHDSYIMADAMLKAKEL